MFRKTLASLLVCLLFLASSIGSSQMAYAQAPSGEWELFTKEEGGYDTYVDPNSITRDGNFAGVWVLSDYSEVQQIVPFMSVVVYYEYDCRHGKIRSQQYREYSGNMGSGDLIDSTIGPSDWLDISTHPQSDFVDQLRNSVCYSRDTP